MGSTWIVLITWFVTAITYSLGRSHKEQLGLNCSYNYDHILLRSRCIRNELNQWEICFNTKVFYDVCDMFQCRLNLCRRAYLAGEVVRSHSQHPSCRIIERMLIEAFHIAENQGVRIRTSVAPLSLRCSS